MDVNVCQIFPTSVKRGDNFFKLHKNVMSVGHNLAYVISLKCLNTNVWPYLPRFEYESICTTVTPLRFECESICTTATPPGFEYKSICTTATPLRFMYGGNTT